MLKIVWMPSLWFARRVFHDSTGINGPTVLMWRAIHTSTGVTLAGAISPRPGHVVSTDASKCKAGGSISSASN